MTEDVLRKKNRTEKTKRTKLSSQTLKISQSKENKVVLRNTEKSTKLKNQSGKVFKKESNYISRVLARQSKEKKYKKIVHKKHFFVLCTKKVHN